MSNKFAMTQVNKMLLTVILALAAGCIEAQPDSALTSDAGTVTNVRGRRVILSYRMPIPNDDPEPDIVTRCYVEGYDEKQTAREFTLPFKLDELTAVIPEELKPFRQEGVVLKDGPEAGTRQILYAPKGTLFHKRLLIIIDSRGRLRQLDFRGDIHIDLGAKTISVVLSDRPEHNKGDRGQ